MLTLAAGLVLLATLSGHPSALAIGWRMVVCGTGFALFQSPNNRALIASAPLERTGGASGMLGTARLLGQTTGAALVAALAGTVGPPPGRARVGPGRPHPPRSGGRPPD